MTHYTPLRMVKLTIQFVQGLVVQMSCVPEPNQPDLNLDMQTFQFKVKYQQMNPSPPRPFRWLEPVKMKWYSLILTPQDIAKVKQGQDVHYNDHSGSYVLTKWLLQVDSSNEGSWKRIYTETSGKKYYMDQSGKYCWLTDLLPAYRYTPSVRSDLPFAQRGGNKWYYIKESYILSNLDGTADYRVKDFSTSPVRSQPSPTADVLKGQTFRPLLEAQNKSGLKHVIRPDADWRDQQTQAVVRLAYLNDAPQGSGTIVRIVQLDPYAARVSHGGRKAKVIVGLLTNFHVIRPWLKNGGFQNILKNVKLQFGYRDDRSPGSKSLPGQYDVNGSEFYPVDYDHISAHVPEQVARTITSDQDFSAAWDRNMFENTYLDYQFVPLKKILPPEQFAPGSPEGNSNKFVEYLNEKGYRCHTIFIDQSDSQEMLFQPKQNGRQNWRLFGQTTAQTMAVKPFDKGTQVSVSMYTDPIGRIVSQNGEEGDYFEVPLEWKGQNIKYRNRDYALDQIQFDNGQTLQKLKNRVAWKDRLHVDNIHELYKHCWAKDALVDVKLNRRGSEEWSQQRVESRRFADQTDDPMLYLELKLKIHQLPDQQFTVRVDRNGVISGDFQAASWTPVYPWTPNAYVYTPQNPQQEAVLSIRRKFSSFDSKYNKILGRDGQGKYVVQVLMKDQSSNFRKYIFVDYTLFDFRPLSNNDDVGPHQDVSVDQKTAALQLFQFPSGQPLEVFQGNVLQKINQIGRYTQAMIEHSCRQAPGSSGGSVWLNHNSKSSQQDVVYPSIVALLNQGQKDHTKNKAVDIEPCLREIADHGSLYVTQGQNPSIRRKNGFQDWWEEISWCGEGRDVVVQPTTTQVKYKWEVYLQDQNKWVDLSDDVGVQLQEKGVQFYNRNNNNYMVVRNPNHTSGWCQENIQTKVQRTVRRRVAFGGVRS